jgi:hypothetical protein
MKIHTLLWILNLEKSNHKRHHGEKTTQIVGQKMFCISRMCEAKPIQRLLPTTKSRLIALCNSKSLVLFVTSTHIVHSIYVNFLFKQLVHKIQIIAFSSVLKASLVWQY